jgi:hypothetical protein
LEANSEERVSEHQEVPKEEAAVESIGSLEDRNRDQHLAVGRCRRQPKKWSQGDGVSRQRLATAPGRLIRPAVPAPLKGHGRQGLGKDDVLRETPKRWTFEKIRRARPK